MNVKQTEKKPGRLKEHLHLKSLAVEETRNSVVNTKVTLSTVEDKRAPEPWIQKSSTEPAEEPELTWWKSDDSVLVPTHTVVCSEKPTKQLQRTLCLYLQIRFFSIFYIYLQEDVREELWYTENQNQNICFDMFAR